jgi:cytochrome c556
VPRRLPPLLTTGLVAVLLGISAAGCASAPSQDTYLSRGDAICKQTTAAQAKLKAPAKGNLPATAAYLRASADLIDKELSQLRKLKRPHGAGERLGDLLSREGDAIATLRHAADAAGKGQQSSADALFAQGEGELSDVGAGLRDYGFSICGT